MVTRRQFIQGAGAAVAGLAGTGLAAAAPGKGEGTGGRRLLRFAYITDCHAREELGAPEALEKLARLVNAQQPERVLIGGDSIHGGFYLSESAARARCAIFRERFLERLEAPADMLFGNHDLAGVAPEDPAARLGEPRRVFLEEWGLERTWRRIDAGPVTFFLLDTVEVLADRSGYRGHCPEEQLAWLADELEAIPRSRPLVAVTHIPLRTTFMQARHGPLAPLEPSLVVDNGAALLGAFAGHNLQLVLQGHLHVNELIRWNGLPLLMGGAGCGGWWQGPNLGTEEGFGIVELFADGSTGWTYHDAGWQAHA